MRRIEALNDRCPPAAFGLDLGDDLLGPLEVGDTVDATLTVDDEDDTLFGLGSIALGLKYDPQVFRVADARITDHLPLRQAIDTSEPGLVTIEGAAFAEIQKGRPVGDDVVEEVATVTLEAIAPVESSLLSVVPTGALIARPSTLLDPAEQTFGSAEVSVVDVTPPAPEPDDEVDAGVRITIGDIHVAIGSIGIELSSVSGNVQDAVNDVLDSILGGIGDVEIEGATVDVVGDVTADVGEVNVDIEEATNVIASEVAANQLAAACLN